MTHPDTKRYLLRLIEMERAIAYHKGLIKVLEQNKDKLYTELRNNEAVHPDLQDQDPFLVRVDGEVWEIEGALSGYDDFRVEATNRKFVELDLTKESQEWLIDAYKLVEGDERDRAERWIDESPFMEPAVRII